MTEMNQIPQSPTSGQVDPGLSLITRGKGRGKNVRRARSIFEFYLRQNLNRKVLKSGENKGLVN